MQGLANKVAYGNCEMLTNSRNAFFVSVSEHLPRFNVDNEVFEVEGELPDKCIISKEFIISKKMTLPILSMVIENLTK